MSKKRKPPGESIDVRVAIVVGENGTVLVNGNRADAVPMEEERRIAIGLWRDIYGNPEAIIRVVVFRTKIELNEEHELNLESNLGFDAIALGC